MWIRKISVGLFALALVNPMGAEAQTAQSCVDMAWANFRAEVEETNGSGLPRGNDYLDAYGWIRSAQTCLEVTEYPSNLAQAARDFKAAISNTERAVERAILADEPAMIFGMSIGAGRVALYPDHPPFLSGASGAGSSDNSGQRGFVMLSQDQWRRVQARLTRMGHDTGGIDGIVGPNTYAAIRRFQRAQGLDTTGVLNSNQLRRLLN